MKKIFVLIAIMTMFGACAHHSANEGTKHTEKAKCEHCEGKKGAKPCNGGCEAS